MSNKVSVNSFPPGQITQNTQAQSEAVSRGMNDALRAAGRGITTGTHKQDADSQAINNFIRSAHVEIPETSEAISNQILAKRAGMPLQSSGRRLPKMQLPWETTEEALAIEDAMTTKKKED